MSTNGILFILEGRGIIQVDAILFILESRGQSKADEAPKLAHDDSGL
jgi:hypothetical protein